MRHSIFTVLSVFLTLCYPFPSSVFNLSPFNRCIVEVQLAFISMLLKSKEVEYLYVHVEVLLGAYILGHYLCFVQSKEDVHIF